MLGELDLVVYLKSHHDLDQVAELVFTALKSQFNEATDEETGARYFQASGLGFDAVLFPNEGDMLDPEFEDYQYSMDLTAQYWCVDLEPADFEEPLSEYYARMLAFLLDVETATEILLEAAEDGERLLIRAYRRNPQYHADVGPTVPKVFMIEEREVFEPYDEEEEEENVYGEEEENL